MGEQDAIRAALGLPSLAVVDLRPQPGTTEPVGTTSTAEVTPAKVMGGVAELIRDGGTPFSPTAQLPASQEAADHCGTIAGPTIC